MRLLFVVFTCGACATLQGQNLTPKIVQADAFMRRVAVTSNQIAMGQQIPTFPMSPGVKINEVYLDKSWKKSSITLYDSDKPIEGFMVRYDLRSNSIEFNINHEIKVLDVRKVKTLIWLDSLGTTPHYFVNGKEYYVDNVPFTSLLEVLTEGKFTLYKQYTYWIKKADYVVALDVGSRDEKIYKEDRFYFGTEKVLTLKPEKKKAFPALFGEQAPAVKKFMRDNDLKTTSEADLVKIFDYYNSLP